MYKLRFEHFKELEGFAMKADIEKKNNAKQIDAMYNKLAKGDAAQQKKIKDFLARQAAEEKERLRKEKWTLDDSKKRGRYNAKRFAGIVKTALKSATALRKSNLQDRKLYYIVAKTQGSNAVIEKRFKAKENAHNADEARLAKLRNAGNKKMRDMYKTDAVYRKRFNEIEKKYTHAQVKKLYNKYYKGDVAKQKIMKAFYASQAADEKERLRREKWTLEDSKKRGRYNAKRFAGIVKTALKTATQTYLKELNSKLVGYLVSKLPKGKLPKA